MSECIATGLLVQQVILYLDIKLFAVYCCTVNTFAILPLVCLLMWSKGWSMCHNFVCTSQWWICQITASQWWLKGCICSLPSFYFLKLLQAVVFDCWFSFPERHISSLWVGGSSNTDNLVFDDLEMKLDNQPELVTAPLYCYTALVWYIHSF